MALVVAWACTILFLTGCAAVVQTPAPSNDQAEQPTPQATEDTPTVPPGYRLEQYTLCYEEVNPSPGRPPRRPSTVKFSILVRVEDCLKLESNGWFSVGPEKCPQPVPDRSNCKKK